MTEISHDVHEDYEVICALLGPLGFPTFCEGYLAYERRKSWTPPPLQMQMALSAAN